MNDLYLIWSHGININNVFSQDAGYSFNYESSFDDFSNTSNAIFNISSIVVILVVIAFIGIFIFGAIMIIKAAKKNYENFDIKNSFDDGSDNKNFNTDELKSEKYERNEEYVTCEYCGSKIKKTDQKCPNCGARFL